MEPSLESVDEHFARLFPKKPAAAPKPSALPKVFTVLADHPWIPPRRVITHATRKGAEITAAELTNVIRKDVIDHFDLAEDDLPKATCANFETVLDAMFRYDHDITASVEIVETDLELI